jgi:predicted ATPase
MMLELNLLGFQIILKFKWIVFIYNPTAHLTVKAQVYITTIGGVAHAYPSSVNHFLY